MADTTPDPYAMQTPAFPHQDLYDVRPQGSAFRRGRGWLVAGAIFLAIAGVIASDWMSKSRPAVAYTGPVDRFGVTGIPDEVYEKPQPEVVEKKEEEKKKAPAKPKLREKVLGMPSAHDNPSELRATREIASWNSGQGRNVSIANRRQSALGN